MSCRPFPRTRHGGVHLSLALRRALVKRCHSADTIHEADFADRSAALRWPAASPAVCGGLCEEAATPGQPVSRQSAFWRTLPAIHPRELPGTAGSAAMLRQGMQNISLDVSNVLLRRLRFKQKSASLCAESVDGRNSLWKALEKRIEFRARLALLRGGKQS